MAEEIKPAEAAPAANPNAQAENDVKNMLAELKGEGAEKKDQGATGANGDEAKKTAEADAEAKEEERIVAAANKVGQDAKSTSESTEHKEQGRGRGDRGDRGSYRGRGNQKRNYRDNIKSDLTSQETTSDPVQIRKQVEFYFSDSNLPMDKFLFNKVGGSENRPVELELLHSFKRMRRFQPFSAIVDALKESSTLELTDDNTCVRRKVPLPSSVTEAQDPDAIKLFEDEAMPRSIYAKGFGEEGPGTQFDIEAFFAPYGPTNAIRLRRTYDKVFKGSVFVEFENEDLQKAFLALDPKPKWKGTTELQIKSKKEYCDGKVEDIKAGRVRPSENRPYRGRGGNRGARDERDWRERRDADQRQGFRGRGRGGHRRGGDRGDNGNRKETEKDTRGVPLIKSTQTESKPAETTEETATAGQKRAREETSEAQNGENGAASEEHPAKKVDAKEG